jgi:hypothetical protein
MSLRSPPQRTGSLYVDTEAEHCDLEENQSFREEYHASSIESTFFYMLVALSGSTYLSIYDGVTEYRIGEILRTTDRQECDSQGFCVYASIEECLEARVPKYAALFVAPRVILKCLAWGDMVSYSTHLCFSCVKPIDVICCPIGYRCHRLPPHKLSSITLNSTRTRLPDFTTYKMQFSTRAAPFHARPRLNELASDIQCLENEVAVTKHAAILLRDGSTNVTPSAHVLDVDLRYLPVSPHKAELRSPGISSA